MTSFSTAIISDSQSAASSLPAWNASVGWVLGIVMGLSAGIYQITNSNQALSMELFCLELFLHYTLVAARDPKSAQLTSN